MGAKVAFPEKTCVNLMGDVAVGMAGTDFETAAREKLGIITVIVNNGAMGGYEKNIPIATERYGTKYVTGEYARMAEALGAYAEHVTDPGRGGSGHRAGEGDFGDRAAVRAGGDNAGGAGVFAVLSLTDSGNTGKCRGLAPLLSRGRCPPCLHFTAIDGIIYA